MWRIAVLVLGALVPWTTRSFGRAYIASVAVDIVLARATTLEVVRNLTTLNLGTGALLGYYGPHAPSDTIVFQGNLCHYADCFGPAHSADAPSVSSLALLHTDAASSSLTGTANRNVTLVLAYTDGVATAPPSAETIGQGTGLPTAVTSTTLGTILDSLLVTVPGFTGSTSAVDMFSQRAIQALAAATWNTTTLVPQVYLRANVLPNAARQSGQSVARSSDSPNSTVIIAAVVGSVVGLVAVVVCILCYRSHLLQAKKVAARRRVSIALEQSVSDPPDQQHAFMISRNVHRGDCVTSFFSAQSRPTEPPLEKKDLKSMRVYLVNEKNRRNLLRNWQNTLERHGSLVGLAMGGQSHTPGLDGIGSPIATGASARSGGPESAQDTWLGHVISRFGARQARSATITGEGTSIAEDTPRCAICCDTFLTNEYVRQLHCHHVFHQDCIDLWLIKCCRLCPICKHDCTKPLVAAAASSSRTAGPPAAQ
ncbi:hypothetical protein IWQ60_002102 [Tieghemiomyces parasiticus]|uniref:RING-type domain-containing protein n=1 Tax=Tieghemiomyces parasiticus TaxID=78921 RepID=A0A9W8AK13_9FUNG|nr:hypothetical protein IWQ60_002102 [Tieghemiomyces parasiticus]